MTFNALEYIAAYDDLILAFGANEDAGAAHYSPTAPPRAVRRRHSTGCSTSPPTAPGPGLRGERGRRGCALHRQRAQRGPGPGRLLGRAVPGQVPRPAGGRSAATWRRRPATTSPTAPPRAAPTAAPARPTRCGPAGLRSWRSATASPGAAGRSRRCGYRGPLTRCSPTPAWTWTSSAGCKGDKSPS